MAAAVAVSALLKFCQSDITQQSKKEKFGAILIGVYHATFQKSLSLSHSLGTQRISSQSMARALYPILPLYVLWEMRRLAFRNKAF